MNTVVNVNGFEIEITGGLNDAFIKVVNNKGEIICDLNFDQQTTASAFSLATSIDSDSSNKARDAIANNGCLIVKGRSNPKMDKWKKAYDKIQARVSHLDKVVYSAFREDYEGIPIDNLDEEYYPAWLPVLWDDACIGEGGVAFEKALIFKPTMLDLCELADAAIKTTGDNSHVYFEGLKMDDHCVWQLIMGS